MPPSGSRVRRDWVLASAMGAAVFGVYMAGSGRAFSLDASVTVARYVATRSLLDPLRHQLVYNNHVLFSLADHLVYSLTSSRSEVVLRVLPVAAAAAALAITVLVIARWTNRGGAVAATTLVAWAPLMLANCREVRGYSFLLLSATLSTALFVRIRSGRQPPPRLAAWGYAGSIALGIATHVYAGAVIVLHAAAIGRDVRALRSWAPRWTAAIIAGLLPLAGVAHEMLSAGGQRGRVFQPRFPLDLGKALLGGAAVPVLVTAALVVLGATDLLRHEAWARRVALATCVVVGVPWLVGPRDLYPRFFVWLIPAVAALIAVAIQRRRWLLIVAVALAVLQVLRLAPTLGESELANRSAAGIASRLAARGERVCTFGLSDLAMAAYAPRVRNLGDRLDRLRYCDVVVQVFTPVPSELSWPPAVAAGFPRRLVLPAVHPGVVSARAALRSSRS